MSYHLADSVDDLLSRIDDAERRARTLEQNTAARLAQLDKQEAEDREADAQTREITAENDRKAQATIAAAKAATASSNVGLWLLAAIGAVGLLLSSGK